MLQNPKIHPITRKPPENSPNLQKNSNSSFDSFKKSKEFRASKITDKYNESLVHSLRESQKKNDTICAIFSCFTLLFAWIESDIFFNNSNISTNICHILRAIVTILCTIDHYYIYRHYNYELEILKSRRIIYQKTRLLSSNLFKYYLIEISFNYLHCPPFFDFVLPNEQLGIHFSISFNAYITVIMLGRLYIVFRLFGHYTFWTGERATRVCKINGFLPDSKFAIKAYLKYKPYSVLVICMGFSIFFFGFALRTFERPYISAYRRFNFDYLWNSFWCVVVTMTTIGYGDIYPQTHLGRLVIIVACIWGVFILSLFVVALNNTITLSKEESKAYEQITHQDTIKKEIEITAATIITKLMRLNLAKKKKFSIKKKIIMKMDLRGLASRFRIKRKNANRISKKIPDILNEMHEEVNRDVGELILSIQPLKKTLPNVLEAEEIQGIIKEKAIEVFENAKKLMSLFNEVNKGVLGENVKELKDVEAKYDCMGNEVDIGAIRVENEIQS